ncbi:histidine kinase [Sporolactobacillus pectinivorans]|uniref:histidine kinase n=1 Tax=Sporolactobacillus pectinivorans TaxID=1591408 RepID=UPI000C267383|nr:histidine kinase [Sporolactobacillus pectinivorans]
MVLKANADGMGIKSIKFLNFSFLLFCLLCSLLVAAYSLLTIIAYPDIGLRLEVHNNKVVVTDVDPYSWAAGQTIRAGDQILYIDGKKAINFIDGSGYLYHAKNIETFSKGVHHYQINNTLSFLNLSFSLLIPAAFFLCCFLLSILLFKHHRTLTNETHVLIVFFSVIGPVFLDISTNQRILNWTGSLIEFSMTMGLVLLIHFLMNYFQPWSHRISSRLLCVLYFCSLIIFVSQIYGTFNFYLLLYFVFFTVLFILFLLAVLYFQSQGKGMRKQIQVLLLGFFMGLFPFVILYTLPNLMFQQAILDWEWTTPFFILVPLTLGYLVLSSVMIDVDFIVDRFSYYGAISFIFTGLSLATFFILAPDQSLLNYVRFALCIFGLSLLILYSKEYVDFRFRKQLFPKWQDYQESLNRLLEWARPGYKLTDLAFILKREMEHCLPVENVTLKRKAGRSAKSPGIDKPEDQSSQSCQLPQPGNLKQFQTNAFGFCVLLFENPQSCVLLSGRWNKPRKELNIDEKMWLESVLNNTQIMIENLYKAEELVDLLGQAEQGRYELPGTVKRALFRVSERERKRLSRDLHDTSVQDQLALARDMDAEKGNWSDPSVQEKLASLRQRVLGNVHELRQVVYELYPVTLQRKGLYDSLQDLFQLTEMRASFSLHTYVKGSFDIENPDLKTAVYRVSQELLTNAIKHSQAKNVTLIIAQEKDHYELLYDDDGIGMEENVVGQPFSTMGLPGLIGRVESTAGRVIIHSVKEETAQKGLHFEIVWPLH